MFRWIAITVLAIGVVGTAIWGFQQKTQRDELYVQSENDFQRAFHELSYHMDMLHDTIGTTLAMNSKESLSPQMIEVWRLTSEAQGNVGQLPLGLLPFNKTEEFLSNIGNFSYRTAARDLDKKPLSDKEIKTLNTLYKQAGELKDELRDVQRVVLEKNLNWTDVDLALSGDDEPKDNTIVDGFKTVEKKVAGYGEAHANSALVQTSTKKHSFVNLQGKKIGKTEALDKALRLMNVKDKKQIRMSESSDGSDIPEYHFTYDGNKRDISLDLSVTGGHPISLLIERPIKDKKLSLHDGQEKAEAYLKKLGFKNMKVYHTGEYDHTGLYSFLYEQDGVRIFSDTIDVKVALDNGEVLGLSARNYFMNHKNRSIEKPKISTVEARGKVNPSVKIEEDHLAIIDDEFGKEVLVYEFLGTLGDDTYRIFINANNGREEKIERLKITELTMM